MTRWASFFLYFAGLLSVVTAGPAQAAPVAADPVATATVQLRLPATVRRLQDLNFASLTVTTAGTAVINPNTDAMTTTGGVLHVGGTPYAALFEGVSPS